jgi:hypothetical protein
MLNSSYGVLIMSNSFSSDVRVWSNSRNIPIGVGFVVSPSHVITCAHVVADALGDRQLAYGQYDSEWNIQIDFPSVPSGKVYTAKIRGWAPLDRPAPDDMAILELNESIPEEVKPITICKQYIPGDFIRAFGIRGNLPRGTYVEGKYLGEVVGRLEITSEHEDKAIDHGCSGGAVWLANGNGVIGMTTAKILKQTGYALPIEEIAKFFKAKTGLDILDNGSDWYVDELIIKMFDVGVELSDEERLKIIRTMPMGPAFDPFKKPLPKIKKAYAIATTAITAVEIISDANQLLLDSLPEEPENTDPYILKSYDLPNPNEYFHHYWASVFVEACRLSPRLVGSLLVVTPPPVLIGIKEDVLVLLKKLRGIK